MGGVIMQAGKLNRVVTVQRLVETVSPSGAVAQDWQDILTCRAEVREQTAEEKAMGFGLAEAETLVFVVRWHPVGISTGDRILHAGRAYDLKQIAEIGRREGWKLRGVVI